MIVNSITYEQARSAKMKLVKILEELDVLPRYGIGCNPNLGYPGYYLEVAWPQLVDCPLPNDIDGVPIHVNLIDSDIVVQKD